MLEVDSSGQHLWTAFLDAWRAPGMVGISVRGPNSLRAVVRQLAEGASTSAWLGPCQRSWQSPKVVPQIDADINLPQLTIGPCIGMEKWWEFFRLESLEEWLRHWDRASWHILGSDRLKISYCVSARNAVVSWTKVKSWELYARQQQFSAFNIFQHPNSKTRLLAMTSGDSDFILGNWVVALGLHC